MKKLNALTQEFCYYNPVISGDKFSYLSGIIFFYFRDIFFTIIGHEMSGVITTEGRYSMNLMANTLPHRHIYLKTFSVI